MLAVILSAREILEWSTAAQVVDTVVIAARNPRIVVKSPRAKLIPGAKPVVRQLRTPFGIANASVPQIWLSFVAPVVVH